MGTRAELERLDDLLVQVFQQAGYIEQSPTGDNLVSLVSEAMGVVQGIAEQVNEVHALVNGAVADREVRAIVDRTFGELRVERNT